MENTSLRTAAASTLKKANLPNSVDQTDGAIFSLAAADRPDGQASVAAIRIELLDRTGIWTAQLKKYFSAASKFERVDRCLQVFDECHGDFWSDIQNSLGSADVCVVFPGQLSGSQTEIFCKKLVDLLQRAKTEYAVTERPELCFVLTDSQDALVAQLRADLASLGQDEFNFRIEVIVKLEGKAAWAAISHPYADASTAPGLTTDLKSKTIALTGEKASNIVNFVKPGSSPATDSPASSSPASTSVPSSASQIHAVISTDRSSPQEIPPTQTQGNTQMASLKESLDQVMAIDGAIAVALVDYNSGMLLGKAGTTSLNLDVAAAGNSEVVKAKQKTMKSLGLNDQIDDILITLGTQYHLIRLLPAKPGLFLYFALDKAKANLAMARYKLSEIEKTVAF